MAKVKLVRYNGGKAMGIQVCSDDGQYVEEHVTSFFAVNKMQRDGRAVMCKPKIPKSELEDE